MFACIGYIVPEYFKWPGELSPKLGLQFADIPQLDVMSGEVTQTVEL